MLNKINQLILMAVISSCVSTVTFAGLPETELTVFNADFNDKIPGTLIGEGGNAFGEPSDTGALTAEIVESSPGENYLEIIRVPASTSGSGVYWDFLDGDEITEGLVTFSFQFTPSALDRYSYSVKEAGGSSRTFLQAVYASSGLISVTDAAGVVSVMNNTYSAGVIQDVKLVFDMDAGTSSMSINGDNLFSERLHGVSDRGIGRLITGYTSGSDSTFFSLDNFSVSKSVKLPLVLDVDFEDKVLGESIGTGGAAAGEPATISTGMITEIIDSGDGNQALVLEKNSTANTLTARWKFLENVELYSGIVAIELDVNFPSGSTYQIHVRESNTSTASYTTIRFYFNGSIEISDSNSTFAALSDFQADQWYRLRITFDLDTGLYGALLDDAVLVDDRAHGVDNGRGIGAVLTSFHSSSPLGSLFYIDDLQVGSSFILDDIIYADGFE